MRDKWFADNRDLVKWSVLLTLAERHAATHILRVLYHRPTKWADLEVDGEDVALPIAAIRHFRNTSSVSAIDVATAIEVMADPFDDRHTYHRKVIEKIRHRGATPGIVFLDPDTGLASRSPTLDHVLDAELSDIWRELKSEDILVFYQHQTNRNGEPWILPKKDQFEQAIGLPVGGAKLARSEKIARDVAFFYAKKAG
jgi:hypothetical protein